MKRLSNRKLRNVLLVGVIAAVAALTSGCASVTRVGSYNRINVWKQTSGQIVLDNLGPTCDQDVNHDGTKGDLEDRARCTLFIIRVGVCNQLSGVAQTACIRGTEATDLNLGDMEVIPRYYAQTAGSACLFLDFTSSGSVPGSWFVEKLGEGSGGCHP